MPTSPVRPDASTTPEDVTKTRILKAAIEHFAEKGLKNASVRVICKAAGANHALINYYYGSKQLLFQEVMKHCMDNLNLPRIEMLEQLESSHKNKTVPLEKLVDTFVRNFMSGYAGSDSDTRIFLRFYGRLFTDPDSDEANLPIKLGQEVRERFLDAFSRTLPELSRRDLVNRLIALSGVISVLSVENKYLASHLAPGEYESDDVNNNIDRTIKLGCALFTCK